MFFYYKEPAALIDWTLGQQAFNSAMLLIYDAIETRSNTNGACKAEQVYIIFKELDDNSVHELAGQAVDRLSWGLAELNKILTLSSISSTRPLTEQELNDPRLGAKHNEAKTFTSNSTDTVMGNTGMMLLEDSGLQAFVQEAYAPIRWSSPETSDSSMKRRIHLSSTSASLMKEDDVSEKFDVVRSPGGMQSTRGSTAVRSVGGRYTTSSFGKPPSSTRPASPTGFALQHQHAYRDDFLDLHQQQRHGIHLQDNAPQHYPSQVQNSTSTPEFKHQAQFSQLRHNSCPMLPQEEADPPPMRPTYSSPSTMIKHTETHTATSRGPTPALYGAGTESFPTQLGNGPHHMGYPFASYVTSASPSGLTPLTENMSMEDWRRYVGSSGTK
ncbi:hypothetical protein J1614_010894 [Plenodomus biglobosus]|nr:hypothetical protein J1614_010894 [Plenodomus biglobosus]